MTSEHDKWEALCNFIYQTEWSSDDVENEVKAAALDWSEHVLRKEAEADKETLKFIQDDIAKNGKSCI